MGPAPVSGSVWVRRPGSALMQPAELPRLTPQAAIDRSWRVPAGGVLLEPERPQYLPAEPYQLTHYYWR
jgi:hypothetical protein